MDKRKASDRQEKIDHVVTEAETAIIGALLLNNSLWHQCDALKAGDFSSSARGIIFEAIGQCLVKGADLVTVTDYLVKTEKINAAGGLGCLNQYIVGLPILETVQHYVDIVRDGAIRRRLAQVGVDIYKSAMGADLQAAIAHAESAVLQFGQSATMGYLRPQELVDHEERSYKSRRDRNKKSTGASLGMGKLDSMISLDPGNLIILGARTSIGKSAFFGNVMRHNAEVGARVLWVVLEMGAERNFWRLISTAAGLPLWRIRKGALGKDQIGPYCDSLLKLRGQDTWRLYDAPGASVDKIQLAIRRAKSDLGGLDLCIVDYFQLLSRPTRRRSDREEFNDNVNLLVECAARESVPILCGAQLNRDAETDEEKDVPQLKELKGTGNLEEAATAVLFLHRWNRLAPIKEYRGASIIVAKYQDGKRGMVPATFDEETQRWSVE